MSDATQTGETPSPKEMWLKELETPAPELDGAPEDVPVLEPSDEGPEEHYEISGEDSEEPAEESHEDNLAPAIPAPAGMSPDYAETFAQLPPELQTWMVTQEAQRTANYTAKTTEVANKRKETEAWQADVAQMRQQYAQTLTQVTAQPPTPPPAELAASDPDQYMIERARYDEQLDTYNKAQAELARMTQEAEQQKEAALKEFRAAEDAKLPSLLGISEPAKVQVAETELKNYGLSHGIQETQWNNASAVEKQLLWKAMQWDKAVKGGKVTKAGARRSAPKSQKPGPGKPPGGAGKSREDVLQEAVKKGRRGGAQALWAHELENPGD